MHGHNLPTVVRLRTSRRASDPVYDAVLKQRGNQADAKSYLVDVGARDGALGVHRPWPRKDGTTAEQSAGRGARAAAATADAGRGGATAATGESWPAAVPGGPRA